MESREIKSAPCCDRTYWHDDDDDDDECLYVYADSCRKSSLPESGMRRQVLPRVAGSHASKTLRGAQRDDDDRHYADSSTA